MSSQTTESNPHDTKDTHGTKDTWSATEYANTASFVYSDAFTQPILNLLSATEGERIVDFGCGSGELTRVLVDLVGRDGFVLGLDSSANMINKAKQNGITHAQVTDLQSISWDASSSLAKHLLPESFDAVFSNAALHWCNTSPSSVIQNAWKALKPGGRFVAELGGFGNIVGLRSSLYRVLSTKSLVEPSKVDPWYFPSPTAYRSLLEQSGFHVDSIELVPRMTLVPNGLKAWLALFVRKTMLASLNDEQAEEVMEEVVKECEPDMKDEQGNWFIMYVRLRFKAIKPEQAA